MDFKQNSFRQTPYWLQFLFFGQAFQAIHSTTFSGTKNFQLKTGTDNIIHLLNRSIRVHQPDVTISLIENPTLTNGSTEINSFNLDRQLTKSPDLTIYTDPSGISGGTTLYQENLPFADEYDTKETELVLKKDSDYIFRVTPTTSTRVRMSWLWYESGN